MEEMINVTRINVPRNQDTGGNEDQRQDYEMEKNRRCGIYRFK